MAVATRIAFGKELTELAKTKDFLVCNADTKACALENFGEHYPDRSFSIGIAEQNLMGVAAGLASCGNKVFASTFAVFTSMRACEQVRQFICYPNLNVTVVGTHVGLQVGGDGATHAAIEDVAIMRSMPNMTIVQPADERAARAMARFAADFTDPLYVRLHRNPSADIYGPGYRFEHIRKKELAQVAQDFRLIYNKAWARFPGVKPMDEKHASRLMNTLKPIIDEKLIYFAFFNDEPIGFFIMIPDLNRVIGRFKGKFNLINKIRLMLMIRFTRKADRVFGIIFGVSPEFQGKGIESGIVHAFEQSIARGEVNYRTLELAWMGDFNPVMIRMVENYVCAQRLKQHVTYRYLFDRTKEFKRCPRMGINR